MKVIEDLGLKIPANSRSDTPRARKHYLVECKCGTRWEVLAENYNAGKITMCKQCQKAIISKTQIKHGGYQNRKPTRLMSIYKNILDRCYKPSCPAYSDYGAKGVTVCDEWLDPDTGFMAFQSWALANGYSDDLVCDKDYLCNELGIYPKIYSPATCQWITKSQNSQYTSRLTEDEQLCLVEKFLNGTTITILAQEYDYTFPRIVYILEKYYAYQRKPNKRTKPLQ